jgi:CpeT protein
MKKYILFCLMAFLPSIMIAENSNLDQLYQLMIGSFTSEEQSTEDDEFYNISLHMYPIWQNSGEKWLYVEQALADQQDKPYRQRIYKVEKVAENEFVSKVYEIEEDEKFIGKWKEPNFFNKYDKSILIEREGCDVFLKKIDDNKFSGSTIEDNCKSNLRGAKYATSIVTIDRSGIVSWDRGYNKADEQVWGAVKSGYIFKRKR